MSIGELGNGVRRYFHANPDRWLWRDGLLAFGKIMIDTYSQINKDLYLY